MNRILTASAVAIAMAVACFASHAQAETHSFRLAPPSHGHYVPTFGFYSNLSHGYGYYVTGVSHYSAAKNFGLQYGDVIQGATVNGHYHSLTHGGWQHVVREAHHGSGHIMLHVRDRNTGWVVTRWTNTRYW